MAIKDLVFRISGTVAYSDGSHGPFEVSFNSASSGVASGIESDPFPDSSKLNFRNMDESLPGITSTVLGLLPTSVTLTPDAPSTSKPVSVATFFVTGQIARDDNTHDSFAIEWNGEEINHFPDETSTVWSEITAESETSDAVESLFDLLAGTGNTTV